MIVKTILSFVVVIVAMLLFFSAIGLLKLCFQDFKKKRERRDQESKQKFIRELQHSKVSIIVAEFIWNFFVDWMLVVYPLKADDVIVEIVKLDDREILDEIEERLVKKISVELSIPDCFLNKTARDLAVFIMSNDKKS